MEISAEDRKLLDAYYKLRLDPHIGGVEDLAFFLYTNTIKEQRKVIAAEGEMKASRSLKEAADVMHESPSDLLQILNSIAAEKNSTIISPLPIDKDGNALK